MRRSSRATRMSARSSRHRVEPSVCLLPCTAVPSTLRRNTGDAVGSPADTPQEASSMTATATDRGLDAHGITPRGRVIHNPTTAQLYTHALASGAGRLAHGGALVVDTGRFTGRSPQDKFVVDEPRSRDRIWWGEITPPRGEPHFAGLRAKVAAHLADQDVLYV